MAIFIHSREGVAQGDPLAMITYGIGILPLIKNLKLEITDITQPCYTYNSKALCMFEIIESCCNSLPLQGPGRGYHPTPSKSILIVHLENIKAGK